MVTIVQQNCVLSLQQEISFLRKVGGEVDDCFVIADVQALVDQDSHHYHNATNNRGKDHFILLSLLDALLPDIVLQRRLLRVA